MTKNRFVLALALAAILPVLVWAQIPGTDSGPFTVPTPAAEVPPTEAEKVVDEAIKKIEAVGTVKATLRQDVKMLGQQFTISGDYLRAPGYKIYLLLRVSGLGDNGGSMLQVSDGSVLWDRQEALDQPIIRRRELTPILEKLQNPDIDPELREQVLSQLGFAGPEALLIGLRSAAEFNQLDEGELDGKKVWIVRGRWTDRDSLSAPDQPPLPPTGPLPPYVPSLVYLWIGQEDGWPYRVELTGRMPGIMEMKKDVREVGLDGRPVGRPNAQGNQTPTEIVMVYSDVQLDADVGPQDFFFNPPQGERIIDETESIVASLDQLLAQRAAQQRAEAAQREPELPGSLSVPTPPADLPEPPAEVPGPTSAPIQSTPPSR